MGLFDKLKEAANSVADWTEQAVKDASDWTEQAAKDTVDWTGQAIKDASDWTEQAAKDTVDWTGQAIKDASDWTEQAAKDTVDWTGQAIKDASDWTEQAAKDTADWTVQAAKDVGSAVESAANFVVDSATAFAAELITKLLKKADINTILTATRFYHEKTGKDTASTELFLNKIKDIKEDIADNFLPSKEKTTTQSQDIPIEVPESNENKIIQEEKATNNSLIADIANIIKTAPLAEILDTVECVAMMVPALGNVVALIIKALRMMIKVQPIAVATLNGIAQFTETTDSNRYTQFIPDGDDPELEKLRIMVDLAIEDGELSNEELALLNKKVKELGIDSDLFLMGLHNEIKKISQN